MEVAANKPRSVISIIFMGVLLGPIFVMLWLGKGRLALLYLGLAIGIAIATIALESYEWLDPKPLGFSPLYTTASLISETLYRIVGTTHGLMIRQTAANRPWFRWIAIVPATAFSVLLLLSLPVRVFVFQPFDIPSQSMEPNLMVGDYFFVSKTAYGYSRFSFPYNLVSFDGRTGKNRPQRGDMTVFKLPSDSNIDYVKRVIGLPGDRIQMIHGVLNVNGVPAKLEEVRRSPELYQDRELKFFRETLPDGRSYII